ncbi:MAG: anti-sigma factor antagonist [Planctomycetota bacterium]|jgi:anti-sigma B factor antagonist|nr:anti-sigma factor antagonist [Planctomycetota bacterium]
MAVLNFDIKSVSLPSGDEAKAVFLSGSIDASTNQTFEGRLSDILSSGTNKVLLVLTNVKYINSTGLGTIVKCVDTFREQGGDIKLVGVPTKVIALFEMLGLLALFETYETIEEAVGSFDAAAAAAAAGVDEAKQSVQFPIQFKHPVSGMGLNVSQPGRFKDPRSGDYFSVSNDGTIEFYEMSKVRLVDVKVPADPAFAVGLKAMASSLANSQGVSASVTAEIERCVDEACSLIGRNATDATETCNFLMVAEKDKIQIGIVSYGQALNLQQNEPALQVIRQSVDEVKHQVLPTRGYLLTMIKRF